MAGFSKDLSTLDFKKSLAKLSPKQNKLKSYTCLFILNVNEKTSTLLTEVYILTMVLTLSFFYVSTQS